MEGCKSTFFILNEPFTQLRNDFFGPTGANLLRADIEESGGVRHVIAYEAVSNQLVGLKRTLRTAAMHIVPEQRGGIELGEEGKPIHDCFYSGALLAVRGLYVCATAPALASIDTIVLKYPTPKDGEDIEEAKHRDASLVMDLGHTGLKYAVQYERLYDDIEMQLCPEVPKQTYAKAGFGLVFSLVDDAVNTAQSYVNDRLAKQIDEGNFTYDWDSALADILNSPET